MTCATSIRHASWLAIVLTVACARAQDVDRSQLPPLQPQFKGKISNYRQSR